jgi:hypothetical protein
VNKNHWQQNNKQQHMKFINYLEKIIGVDIYALSSFSIFFTFFLLMTLWAWKADKKMIEEISHLPLEN